MDMILQARYVALRTFSNYGRLHMQAFLHLQ
jgi:hypothetical protein